MTNLELRRTIDEAEASGRYLLTLTFTHDGKTFTNYTLTQDFPREEIMPALQQCARLLKKEISVAAGDS